MMASQTGSESTPQLRIDTGDSKSVASSQPAILDQVHARPAAIGVEGLRELDKDPSVAEVSVSMPQLTLSCDSVLC